MPTLDEWVELGVHWVHVICGVFWFGSVLFTRIILFPELRTLPNDYEAGVRDALQKGKSRVVTLWVASGTIVMGVVRGLLDRVQDRLDTAYGITYIAALIIGLAMLAWLVTPWLKRPLFARLYIAGFPVMFTLMVAMRFGC